MRRTGIYESIGFRCNKLTMDISIYENIPAEKQLRNMDGQKRM